MNAFGLFPSPHPGTPGTGTHDGLGTGSPVVALAATSLAAARAAVTAREVAEAASQVSPQVAQLVDELARLMNCRLTTHQAETLGAVFTDAIDARIRAADGRA